MIMSDTQAYYKPNSERANLVVLTGAHTVRMEVAGSEGDSTLIATSVAFLHNDDLFQVKVGKEVVLAAGYVACMYSNVFSVSSQSRALGLLELLRCASSVLGNIRALMECEDPRDVWYRGQ